MSSFRDSATDCAICLTPLATQSTLTLACGHIWHTACLQEQLAHAQPHPSKRLLFTGIRCAKCNVVCEHPSLESVIRPVTALQDKVDSLILSQAAVDGLKASTTEELIQLGRRVYAFYLCSVCNEPYFGGTIECDDQADVQLSDRTCSKCSPRVAAICRESSHMGHYVWKCRYCCQVARFVCYGSTHFCAQCHEIQRQDVNALRPQRCSGQCGKPMLNGMQRHNNGPGKECEQVLWCAWCESDPRGSAALRSERGSKNMIFNSGAQLGLRGWHTLSGFDQWESEQCDYPFARHGWNFVSGFRWAGMAQVIGLDTFVRNPHDCFIEVSARYMARWDCPSVFRMQAVRYTSRGDVIDSFDSQELNAPADYWDRVSHVFEPARGHYLVVALFGKDLKFWQGNFGSKVGDVCVRVRYDDVTEPREVMRENAFDRITGEQSEDARRILTNFESRDSVMSRIVRPAYRGRYQYNRSYMQL